MQRNEVDGDRADGLQALVPWMLRGIGVRPRNGVPEALRVRHSREPTPHRRSPSSLVRRQCTYVSDKSGRNLRSASVAGGCHTSSRAEAA